MTDDGVTDDGIDGVDEEKLSSHHRQVISDNHQPSSVDIIRHLSSVNFERLTIKAAKGLQINSTFAQILRIYDDIRRVGN